MKHGSITRLQSQISSQLNGQQRKTVQSDQKRKFLPDKFLASVFWDTHGILFIDYLEKGRTIDSKISRIAL